MSHNSQGNKGYVFAISTRLILQNGLSSLFMPFPEGGVLSMPSRLKQLHNSRHHTARADYSFQDLKCFPSGTVLLTQGNKRIVTSSEGKQCF